MSRIGKQPITIPAGVTVDIQGNLITVKGSKGELKQEFRSEVKVEVVENQILITRKDDSKDSKSLHGLVRSLVANMVEGVTKGFEKRLEIVGVGYRAKANKNKITLTLGFSHDINYTAPESIDIKMDEEAKNTIVVTGIDKQIVGEVAAKIRSYRKPEPYKGKGIRYMNEQVKRKSGKAAGSGA